MIEIKNLSKKFNNTKVLDKLSFSVKRGEVLGFLGPNGAGKTTTMKAITTFFTPTQGNISVGNLSVVEQAEEVKKHIGYLPENNPLYQEMPIIDYLTFVAELQGVEKSIIKDRILEMVNVCGLEGEKHKRINELSKGYKQRVGLAQALIHNPDVLILDEPTAGLDPNQIVEIRELIKQIGKEKTVILSSHILAEVEATCDRMLIISKGKIVADGTPKDLKKQAQGKEIVKVTIEGSNADEIFTQLQSLDNVDLVDFIDKNNNSFEIQSKSGQSSRKSIFNLCVEKSWVLLEMTPIETKLEDIFRELTMN